MNYRPANLRASTERVDDDTGGIVAYNGRLLDKDPVACGDPLSKPRQSRSERPTAENKPRVRRIGSLVSQLMSRRGYAQVAANEDLRQAIASVIGGQLESAFQVGNLRQGVLQVYAADSVTLQELNFRKRIILKHLQRELPDNKVTDLRFRIQA